MKNRWLVIGLALLLFSCQAEPKESADFDRLVMKSPYTAVMFFAPDCPLCITFSKPYNQLMAAYGEKVQFLAVQSGRNYEAMELKMFIDETGLNAPVFLDRDYLVAKKYTASTTPEFLLISRESGVVYQGLLDNRMKVLGVYKQHWDAFYLKEAIEAVLKGSEPEIKFTTSIGCVLEYQ